MEETIQTAVNAALLMNETIEQVRKNELDFISIEINENDTEDIKQCKKEIQQIINKLDTLESFKPSTHLEEQALEQNLYSNYKWLQRLTSQLIYLSLR